MSISGALFTLSGEVSNNATWDEYIYFLQSGVGMTLEGLAFELQFRSDSRDTSAEFSLTTAAGDLEITDDDNDEPTILRINVPYTSISGMSGDYQADLVSKDAIGKMTHWASGTVTFGQSPVAF
jgi:hypothetical protein